MTLREVKRQAAEIGAVVKDTGWGDYRLSMPEKDKKAEEDKAYYSDDLEDVADTIKAWKEGRR